MATATITISDKIRFGFNYTVDGTSSPIQATVTVTPSSITSGALSHPYNFEMHATVGNHTALIAYGSITTSGTVTVHGGVASTPVDKQHSASTATVSFRVVMAASDSSSASHDKSTSASLSIPAKTSYKVTFYANGGSGAPSQQTKWHGEPLTLTRATPTCTGYDFVKWNTQPGGGGTDYSSGGTVAANTNGALNLYAIWSLKTYTITYNKNGGASGTTSSQTKTHGTPLTLRANGFTGQTNMGFDTWNTKADGTGTNYQAAQTNGYTANASATMYAIWKQIYASPKLTIKKAYRCDSGGSPDDEGTYLGVEATYTLFDTGNNAISSWTLSCNGQSTTTPTSGGTGLSGNVKMVLNASLDVNTKYTATLTLRDTAGGSGNKSTNTTSKTVSIGTAAYPIDVHAGGDGVAIGGVARRAGWLDVGNGFSAAFASNGRFDTTDAGHTFASASQAVDGQGNPTNEYGNTWNCYDSAGNYIGYSQVANAPTGVYRSFAVKNPRTGNTMAIYLHSDDDGTIYASLYGSGTWEVADIPNLPASKITSGTLPIARGGTGESTASAAWTALGGGALGKKNSLAASDITDALGYTPYSASASRTANTVLAAPNGSAGTASFRKLVAADIPTLTMSKISDAGTLAKKSSGTVAADADTTTVSKTKTYSVAASGATTVQFTDVSADNHTFMGIRRLTTGAQTAVGVIGWYLDGTTLNVYLKNFSTSAQNDKTCALVACFVKTSSMTRSVSFS